MGLWEFGSHATTVPCSPDRADSSSALRRSIAHPTAFPSPRSTQPQTPGCPSSNLTMTWLLLPSHFSAIGRPDPKIVILFPDGCYPSVGLGQISHAAPLIGRRPSARRPRPALPPARQFQYLFPSSPDYHPPGSERHAILIPSCDPQAPLLGRLVTVLRSLRPVLSVASPARSHFPSLLDDNSFAFLFTRPPMAFHAL